MRPHVLAVLLAAAPALTRAQAPNRTFSLESGLSSGRAGAGLALALSTSAWLEGPLDATATLGWASASRTTGRAADLGPVAWATAGLRATAGDGLRVSAGLELGAAQEEGRVGAAAGGSVGLALPAGPVTLGIRGGARRGPGGWRREVLLGIALCY